MTVEASSVHGILREMLRPYPALDEGRVTIGGDDVPIDDRGATPFALAFHELATNAAKYGALSTPHGTVTITCRRDGNNLTIDWCERGGPAIDRVPERSGFGTKLVNMSIIQQLNGSISRSWDREGLHVELSAEPRRLIRGTIEG